MRVEFRLDPGAAEPRVLVIARQRTSEVEALLRRIAAPQAIPAWDERGEALLAPEEIVRVYTERRCVLAESDRGTFALRSRLYELEAGGGLRAHLQLRARAPRSDFASRLWRHGHNQTDAPGRDRHLRLPSVRVPHPQGVRVRWSSC